MYRSIPTPNKILSKKWNQINLDLHKSKINQIKRVTYNIPNIKRNKSLKINRVKSNYDTISRQNRILTKRILDLQCLSPPGTRGRMKSIVSLNSSKRKKGIIRIMEENSVIT